MSYLLDEQDVELPVDPQFGEGRDIDAEDWDDIMRAIHWLKLRRGGRGGGFYVPTYNDGNPGGTTSTTFSGAYSFTDTDLKGQLMRPQRGQGWHDAHDDGSGVVYRIMSIVAHLKVISGRAQGRIAIGSFDPSNGRQDTGIQGDVRTPWTDTQSRHTIVGIAIVKHHAGVPIWGVGEGRVESDGGEADFFWFGMKQPEQIEVGQWMDPDAPSTSQARAYGAPWVEMQNDGDTLSGWDGDAAHTGWTAEGEPVLLKGEINAGADSYDELSAASTTSTDVFVSDETDDLSGAAGVWAACAVRRDQDHSRATIFANASVELFEEESVIVAAVVTTNSTYTASSSNTSIGTWEDWAFVWSEEGDLVLYKDGVEVDRTATSGELDGGEERYGLSARPDLTDSINADLALPILVEADFDVIQTQRALAWRAARTNLTSVIDVT